MKVKYFLITVIFALPMVGYAFDFTLSETEFKSWDARCKKAYAASGSGRSSGYYQGFSPQQFQDASRFGEEAGGAWHYCAGVIWLQRAASTFGQQREGNLKQAVSEIHFTYNKIKPQHHWYPEIHVNYAKALYLSNKKQEAFAVLQRLAGTHPANSLPYTALAYYLKQEKQLEQAISVLKQAPDLLLNESAELNYFLGWYLMEAGQLQDAVPYAQKAYLLNYPAPALRQRLAAKGYSW
ncbi:hypothetical protein [Rheinheimera gaetbuli]